MRCLLLMILLVCTDAVVAVTRNGFDLDDALIPVKEIYPGGPPRDGIPAIIQPVFETASKAKWPDDDDRVLAVNIGGQPKAYPIAILNWHEVVNDKTGDEHFVISYCPLCGTGMVFAADIADSFLQFGVSGLLYNSDVLLYDRNSESLWSQLLGKAISGKLKGYSLLQLPAVHTSWGAWRKQHPDTLVLSRETGYRRNYSQSPYEGYERTRRLYFDVSHKAPRDIHPKSRVLGVSLNDVDKAYPLASLSKSGLRRFKDQIAGQTYLITWDEASATAQIFDEDGRLVPSVSAFWFAWYTFHPDTLVYQGPQSGSAEGSR